MTQFRLRKFINEAGISFILFIPQSMYSKLTIDGIYFILLFPQYIDYNCVSLGGISFIRPPTQ